jgi:hypothetical protein
MHFTFVESTINTSLRSKYPRNGYFGTTLQISQICVDSMVGIRSNHYTIKSNNIVGFKIVE